MVSPHVPSPPPPHVLTPPQSSDDNHPTVIVIVFISFGCLFFFAFLCVALFCFMKMRKKKTVQETDIVHVDEHLKIKEASVPAGPHGQKAVILSIEDDVHIKEEIMKNERVGSEGLHNDKITASEGNITNAFEEGTSSSSHQHNLENKA